MLCSISRLSLSQIGPEPTKQFKLGFQIYSRDEMKTKKLITLNKKKQKKTPLFKTEKKKLKKDASKDKETKELDIVKPRGILAFDCIFY